MMKLNKCLRLLDEGFSLITVAADKQPNFSWKKQQTTALTKVDFEKQYTYTGGYIKKDGLEMKPTTGIGIVTGFNDLECVDVDLKVFSTKPEKVDFWKEFTDFLKDNIFDFDEKFVIYKTINEGYHILYRTKRVEGNLKLAKLKGHKEAVLETRGIGGYIFVYEDSVNGKLYKDVKYISDEDREILMSICRTYNFIEEVKEEKVHKEFDKSGLTPWEDYNNKMSIFDIIQPELSIVRNISDKYIVKRQGAKSPHSGYVYKNSGCMYLFSTGTIFPHEQLISPFQAYAIKYHNSNFKEAASKLYKEGYGERIKEKKTIEKPKEVFKDISFPLEIFPDELQAYILGCHKYLNNSIDYMGCSLLWLASIIVGNSFRVQVKTGWTEPASLWIALVGQAGIGKTPSINSITFPIHEKNLIEIKKYHREQERYAQFMSLDRKDKMTAEEVKKPRKSQFIVNDITLEALIDLHSENKNGIGILKDELAGWFKEMNRYRQGSDIEHWLSSWSGKEINLNRKVSKSSFVDKACMPVIGGIQPSILEEFYTSENKDNGFIDRMLFSFPDLVVEKYNEKELTDDILEIYRNKIWGFFDDVRHLIRFENDEIKPNIAVFSSEAKDYWVGIFNRITDAQNSDLENEYMKSMYPKQKSYIPRFALLINMINQYESGLPAYYEISKESLVKAEKLSNYFVEMAKKIKANSSEVNNIKKTLKLNDRMNIKEQFHEILKVNPDVNQTKLAAMLGVSRMTISRWMKEVN